MYEGWRSRVMNLTIESNATDNLTTILYIVKLPTSSVLAWESDDLGSCHHSYQL